ncbi:MAG: hypothetical protein QM528_01395 [Phycisphaerales bacterium]|nr:hypothetical protein [Phycisphaerales bacterium]
MKSSFGFFLSVCLVSLLVWSSCNKAMTHAASNNQATDGNKVASTNNLMAVNTPDSLILVKLYNATKGASWINNTNWLTGPVSSWYGITVTNGYVTSISLPNNNLVGVLPDSLGYLQQLTYLNCSHNAIAKFPNGLSGLITIRYLFPSIQHIDLSYNPGKVEFGLGITGIKGPLAYLDLSNTYISSLSNLAIRSQSLQYLNLSHCSGIGKLEATISMVCPNLQHIDLSYNGLFNVNMNLSDFFTNSVNPNNLTYCDLSHNVLSGAIPSVITNYTKVTFGSLDYNGLDLAGTAPAVISFLNQYKWPYANQNGF